MVYNVARNRQESNPKPQNLPADRTDFSFSAEIGHAYKCMPPVTGSSMPVM